MIVSADRTGILPRPVRSKSRQDQLSSKKVHSTFVTATVIEAMACEYAAASPVTG